MPESLITDYASYLTWHQIDEQQDDDGDNLPPPAEFFLGTDIRTADFGVIEFDYLIDESTMEPFVRFTLPRAKLAAPAVPEVQSNALLQGFIKRTDFVPSTTPLDAERDWLHLEAPAPEERQFYKLQFPDPISAW
jgi:hypothetical protein